MSLLSILLAIVVVGVLLWAVNNFIPMDSKVRSVLNAVVLILLIVWLLQAFGILNLLGNVRVGD
ncbi:MAG TPA: Thivi_2564 family membrane protein [Polyangiaceae bacterium]|nr:Thivi_2564 family membrane protein [Polyangiaceae bacterium]